VPVNKPDSSISDAIEALVAAAGRDGDAAVFAVHWLVDGHSTAVRWGPAIRAETAVVGELGLNVVSLPCSAIDVH
jgi:hypothetical protein